MSTTHKHEVPNYGPAFALGIALNLGFVIAEFIYGRRANSMALIADAGHNLSDVLALGLAWGATVLSRRIPTSKRTYGLRRTTVLAALINAAVSLLALGAIAWESIVRLNAPGTVAERTVIIVAAIGVVVNAVSALLFFRNLSHDLNIRSAFAHLAADAAVSAGVVVAGIIITLTGSWWLDPAVSLAIVVVILVGTWNLLRDSINLALDAVPEGIDLTAIQQYLSTLPETTGVHDLHVWGLSTTEAALTAHLVIADSSQQDQLLIQTEKELHARFGIEHSTLQIESPECEAVCRCRLQGGDR